MYYSFTTSTKKELQCELICDVDCILHLHSHFEMVFALDGCVEVSVDDNCYSLQKNEMALITPYSSHSFKTVSSSRIIVIEFPTSYIREYKKLFLGKEFKKTVMPTPETVRDCIKELISEDGDDDFMKISLIYRTFSEYMRKNEMVYRTGISSDVFRRAVEYIHEHYDENPDEATVSKALGVSRVTLSRAINKKQNFTFADIVNTAKIEEAKKLMEETSLSVADVAFRAGFGSIRNFNRLCKKYFNCTPIDLRKKESNVEFLSKKDSIQF